MSGYRWKSVIGSMSARRRGGSARQVGVAMPALIQEGASIQGDGGADKRRSAYAGSDGRGS